MAGRAVGAAQLLKPHGTVSGRLIVNSEQVLRGLDPSWEAQVRADVRHRTVIFVGYSGRDLDFQPMWDSALQDAARVLWFDFPWPDEQARKVVMLREVAAAGRLEFPASLRMHDPVPEHRYPRLSGEIPFARIATQEVLGDVNAARQQAIRLVLRGPHRRRAAGELVSLTLNHGRGIVATVLLTGRLVPPVGRRARRLRALTRRKRTTILSNLGRHSAVLRETARSSPDDVSSLLILRATALRMTGSLDEAAATAGTAMERARRERHPVRLANAAFQRGLSLQWAGRLDEAERNLDDWQRPYASLASTCWVAWADFVEAGLAIHRRRIEDALRAAGDADAFIAQRAALDTLLDPANPTGIRYAKGHRFTREAIALEDAELARVHLTDLDAAERLFGIAASSSYRIHMALGHLGLAMVQAQRRLFPSHAHTAASIARAVNARLVVTKADELLAAGGSLPAIPEELFFP